MHRQINDEARRIAANVAKLLEVLRQSRTASSLSEAKSSTGATCGVTGSEFCETVTGGPAFFLSKSLSGHFRPDYKVFEA